MMSYQKNQEVKLMNLTIYDATKKLRKEKRELRKAVLSSAYRLGQRIVNYQNTGIKFESIYNDDHVKYDKHGNFYTYKSHNSNKSQIRLLYLCKQSDNETVIIIVDYTEKRKTDKSYILKFDLFDRVNAAEYIRNANLAKVCG